MYYPAESSQQTLGGPSVNILISQMENLGTENLANKGARIDYEVCLFSSQLIRSPREPCLVGKSPSAYCHNDSEDSKGDQLRRNESL